MLLTGTCLLFSGCVPHHSYRKKTTKKDITEVSRIHFLLHSNGSVVKQFFFQILNSAPREPLNVKYIHYQKIPLT